MKQDESQEPQSNDALDSLKELKHIQPSPGLQHRALQAMRHAKTRNTRPPRQPSSWWQKSVAVPLPVAVLTCVLLGTLAVYVAASTSNNGSTIPPVKQVQNLPAPDNAPAPSPVYNPARTSQQVAFYLPSAGFISESQIHITEREDQ